jgi:NAD(P) transhydrogenase subunit beta
MTMSSYFMEATYLIASILFILSLKGMSHPETARRGMFLAEGGMFAAIVGTLVGAHIVTWVWIIAGLTVGSIIGAWMAIWVPMTAMPQRTALSHAFGALAAALVGVGEFLVHAGDMPAVTRGALGFERAHNDRLAHRRRQAAGRHPRQAHPIQEPEHRQSAALPGHGRVLHRFLHAS